MTKALVEGLIFLEFSEDETVDPDAAVRTKEEIAVILQDMSRVERQEFSRELGVLASAQSATEMGNRRREFIRGIPEYFGLVESD